jgi:hypothetical protein
MAANSYFWSGRNFSLIPCRSNDCRKVEEHGQRGQQSTALNVEESQGESGFFLRRISAGIGPRFDQGSSASRCLIDSVEAKILRSLYALPLHARRQDVLLVSSTDANYFFEGIGSPR